MKNMIFHTTLTAAAAGMALLLGGAAQAQPPKNLSRMSGASTDGALRPTNHPHEAGSPAPLAPAPADYPRYQLVDLGTLGGPESGVIAAARTMNRWQVIANADTGVPDPTCSLSCYVDHAI